MCSDDELRDNELTVSFDFLLDLSLRQTDSQADRQAHRQADLREPRRVSRLGIQWKSNQALFFNAHIGKSRPCGHGRLKEQFGKYVRVPSAMQMSLVKWSASSLCSLHEERRGSR